MDSLRAASILKNLRTLHIRMKKHSENALYLAENFEEDGLKVVYPGLKSHKGHELFKTMYNKEYIHINDSLQKAERIIGEKFARIEYETDQVKEENVSLTTKNRNIVYIFGSVLIIGMFLYIIKAQKTKTRELLFESGLFQTKIRRICHSFKRLCGSH